MSRYVVIVAGGKGLRMGGGIPKQFLPVGGRPVLMRTIDVFVRACPGIGVVLVLPREQQHYWAELCERYSFGIPVTIADGGETRFHSVRNGLGCIPSEACGVVGVHDGVRPFVAEETIVRCYTEAERSGAVVPVVPVVETIRHLEGDGSRTVLRDEYRLVQTPQVFDLGLLRRAYSQAYRESFTDDASVVESMGHGIRLVEGNRENIKLTTPSDLQYAEYITSTLQDISSTSAGPEAV